MGSKLTQSKKQQIREKVKEIMGFRNLAEIDSLKLYKSDCTPQIIKTLDYIKSIKILLVSPNERWALEVLETIANSSEEVKKNNHTSYSHDKYPNLTFQYLPVPIPDSSRGIKASGLFLMGTI